jgi:Leucine-rich repeat (LRR) protein
LLTGLQQLLAGDNQLFRLPGSVAVLQALVVLSLCGNQLRQLPAGLTALKQLRSLSLSLQ